MVIPQSFVHKKIDVVGTGRRESFPHFLYCCYQDISLFEFTAQCERRGKRQVGQICMLSSTWFEKGFVLKNCGVSGAREGGIFCIYLLLSLFFPLIWLIRRYINVSFVRKKCDVGRRRVPERNCADTDIIQPLCWGYHTTRNIILGISYYSMH